MMELSPVGGNGGNGFPFPVNNACQITGVGSKNQNTEEVIEPEMYDFSSFLEGDFIDEAFLEYKEMLKAGSFQSSSPVEVVEEVAAQKNMVLLVQPPPPPLPSNPPQRRKPIIRLNPRDSGSIKWTEELNACFLDAVEQLGGAFIATPKTVRDEMDVEGLSSRQVKSHLQKYREELCLKEDWKNLHRRGSSYARALSAPSKPAPSPRPSRPKNLAALPFNSMGGQCRCKERLNKQENRSHQMNNLKYLKVQRQNAKIAARRMAVNQTMRENTSAANQKTGAYPIADNQNSGGHVFAANQNIGGNVFSANQKMDGFAIGGRKTYPENGFINSASPTLMPRFPSYQHNQYNGCASAAAVPEGIFVAQKPDELPSIPAAHSYQLAGASNFANAASYSYQQGFNSDSGESCGTAGMSEEEFVNSLLIDYDGLIENSQNNQ